MPSTSGGNTTSSSRSSATSRLTRPSFVSSSSVGWNPESNFTRMSPSSLTRFLTVLDTLAFSTLRWTGGPAVSDDPRLCLKSLRMTDVDVGIAAERTSPFEVFNLIRTCAAVSISLCAVETFIAADGCSQAKFPTSTLSITSSIAEFDLRKLVCPVVSGYPLHGIRHVCAKDLNAADVECLVKTMESGLTRTIETLDLHLQRINNGASLQF